MISHYVVSLHVHCSIHDGYARASGSNSIAHSVLREKGKLLVLVITSSQTFLVVKLDPFPYVLLKKGFLWQICLVL